MEACMRSLRYCFASTLLILVLIAPVQGQSKTDAEMDGLAGPVQSVSSAITQSGVKWQQPDGPTLVLPIWCKDCEYGPDGTKTKSGQLVEGKFFGEIIRLVRDTNGLVTDRYSYSASTGDLQRHDVMGPLGKTEQRVYIGGKLIGRSTFLYDQYGHLSERLDFDAAGKSVDRCLTVSVKDGTVTHESTYGRNGELSYEQVFDPETQVDHFTTFDEFGKVKLTWTVVRGKLASFWEFRDSPSQFGDEFTEPAGDDSFDKYSCHGDLSCDVSHVHYEYLGGDKHTPRSAEWRGSEGKFKITGYF